jgi:Fusaric acid resistance protein-like
MGQKLSVANLADWERFCTLVTAHRAQLRFCLRVTVSGLLAFAIAQVLTIPLHGLWMVLTAVVVTQMSAGGSLRATVEYIIGTFGGAVYAAIIGLLIPHTTAIAQGGVLALTIAPLALAAALNPNFRVAPFSAVLVLLISGQLSEGPIESALYRVAEVAIGGGIAVTVSLLVLPERAHRLGLDATSRVIEQLARVVPVLLAGFERNLDPMVIGRIQDDIGEAVVGLQAIVAEAKGERLVKLVTEPDLGPLPRTLLRLRHDLIIIGRAAVAPLPGTFAERLGPQLTQLGTNASDFLHGCATAFGLRSYPPPLDAVEVALKDYTSEISSLRDEGLTRSLSIGEVERLFALGFALEQLHQHFSDLERRAHEAARSSAGRSQSQASLHGDHATNS